MVSESKSLKALIVLLFILTAIVATVLIVPRIVNVDTYGTDGYKYNMYVFTYNNGVWSTRTQEGNNLLITGLRNGPRELEDIPVEGDIESFRYSSDFFYITFDPSADNHDSNVTMSNAEISPNLVMHMGKDLAIGCIKEDPVCNSTGTPIITCENTDERVIYIRRAPENYISVKDNCAIISGTGEDLVRAADRFMYGMYGIMK